MHACVQSEYKEQREGERRAKKMVRIKLFPMLLYCFFILAAMFYAYVRILFGMGGLVTGLKVYSYIVLVIDEMADLMMQAKKEAEGAITRLAQFERCTTRNNILSEVDEIAQEIIKR